MVFFFFFFNQTLHDVWPSFGLVDQRPVTHEPEIGIERRRQKTAPSIYDRRVTRVRRRLFSLVRYQFLPSRVVTQLPPRTDRTSNPRPLDLKFDVQPVAPPRYSCAPVIKEYNLISQSMGVTLGGWEDNRRCSVALAMCYRLHWQKNEYGLKAYEGMTSSPPSLQ